MRQWLSPEQFLISNALTAVKVNVALASTQLWRPQRSDVSIQYLPPFLSCFVFWSFSLSQNIQSGTVECKCFLQMWVPSAKIPHRKTKDYRQNEHISTPSLPPTFRRLLPPVSWTASWKDFTEGIFSPNAPQCVTDHEGTTKPGQSRKPQNLHSNL